MASPPPSPSLPFSATAAPTPVKGAGFNLLPPLPIVSTTFGFLKSLDLRIVGVKLGDIPRVFRWDLVFFEVDGDQTMLKGVRESDTAQTGSLGVLESSGILSGAEDSPGPASKGVSDLGQT